MEALKFYIFNTEGRLNRLRYLKYAFIFSLVCSAIGGILGFIIGMIFGEGIIFQALQYLMIVPVLVGSIMLQVRRCHDFNKTGWLVLCNAIPGINFIFGLCLLLIKGTTGDNKYGPDPLIEPEKLYKPNRVQLKK